MNNSKSSSSEERETDHDTSTDEELEAKFKDEKNKPTELQKDFYGCFCVKFRVKEGTSVTEEKIYEDFEAFGEVVDIWGAGFVDRKSSKFGQNFDCEVYVRFVKKEDAKAALKGLVKQYKDLTPDVSDVLPDNFGLYTINFINQVSLPSEQILEEFSEFGEIVKLYGELKKRDGRVSVAYRSKEAAIKAFLNKTERWFVDMKFLLPKCETDYTQCYCLKFYNENFATEEKVRRDFGRFGYIVELRGAGLFEEGDDAVYVKYREKASAQHALSSLYVEYTGLCIIPGSEIRADKFGCYSITFVNHSLVTENEVWETFTQFGQVKEVQGHFNVKNGRVFVSMTKKEGVLTAIEELRGSKRMQIQLSNGCKSWIRSRPSQSPDFETRFVNLSKKRKLRDDDWAAWEGARKRGKENIEPNTSKYNDVTPAYGDTEGRWGQCYQEGRRVVWRTEEDGGNTSVEVKRKEYIGSFDDRKFRGRRGANYGSTDGRKKRGGYHRDYIDGKGKQQVNDEVLEEQDRRGRRNCYGFGPIVKDGEVSPISIRYSRFV